MGLFSLGHSILGVSRPSREKDVGLKQLGEELKNEYSRVQGNDKLGISMSADS